MDENKEFQACLSPTEASTMASRLGLNESVARQSFCSPAVEVIYQGPSMLVLTSTDPIICKAVEFAKKEGYKIDGISTYETGAKTRFVNILVAMSKG